MVSHFNESWRIRELTEILRRACLEGGSMAMWHSAVVQFWAGTLVLSISVELLNWNRDGYLSEF